MVSNLSGLDQRRRGHEAGGDGNDEIQDAEQVPGSDETCGFVRGSRIGNTNDRREQTDGDVTNSGRPSK